jgi:tetratricopeptide (TPR) repeat protein
MKTRSAMNCRVAALKVNALAVMACVACSGCSSFSKVLTPPNEKNAAKERWSSVRSKLKLELAGESFTGGQMEEAQKNLDEALSLRPDSGDAYILQAKILLEKGQTAAASEALEEALRHGADTPDTDYLSGVVSQRYEKLDDALAWYRRASRRDPMSAPYVVAVAETLVSLGRPTEAMELVTSRLTDFEQNATLRALAGGIYMMLGRFEEATTSYREASRISPDDSRLKMQLGLALTFAKNYQEAETVLASVGGHDAPDPSVLAALGRCRLALGDGDGAKEVLRKVVDAEPNRARSWVLLARASVESKDLLTARRAATQAVQLQPANREYRLMLGSICWEQKDYPATVSTLEEVLKGGDDDLALYMLADCYRGMGKTKEARETVRRALDANPTCDWAKQWTDTPLGRRDSKPKGRAPAR